MVVYPVLEVEGESETLLGVFSSRELAESFVHAEEGYRKGWPIEYRIVHARLGEMVGRSELVE